MPDSQIVESHFRLNYRQQIPMTEVATPLMRQTILGKRLRKDTTIDCIVEESLEATNESSFNRSLDCASDLPSAASSIISGNWGSKPDKQKMVLDTIQLKCIAQHNSEVLSDVAAVNDIQSHSCNANLMPLKRQRLDRAKIWH